MITPMSVLIVLLYLYTFFKYGLSKNFTIRVLIYYMIFEIFIGAGYFIKIGTFELLFSEFSLAILFIPSLKYFFTMKIKTSFLKYGFIFCIAVVLSYIFSKIINYNIDVVEFSSSWEDYIYYGVPLTRASVNIHSLLLITRVFMFVIILISLKSSGLFDFENVKHLIKKCYYFIVLYTFFLIVEFFIKYFLNPFLYTNAINLFFGVGAATYYEPIYRSGLCCLQGLGKEPSALSFSIFFASLIIILYSFAFNNKKRKCFVFLIILQVLSLLSLSLSSFIFIISSLILFALFGKEKIRIITLIFYGFVLVLIVGLMFKVDYFSQRINSIFVILKASYSGNFQGLNYSTTSGEVPRIISIIRNLVYFFRYPLFGLGIGSTYAHSFLASLFSNIGLAGFITWLLFISRIFTIKRPNIISILTVIFLFIFQGYLGLFYSISFVLVVCLYFDFHRKCLEEKNGRNCYSKL